MVCLTTLYKNKDKIGYKSGDSSPFLLFMSRSFWSLGWSSCLKVLQLLATKQPQYQWGPAGILSRYKSQAHTTRLCANWHSTPLITKIPCSLIHRTSSQWNEFSNLMCILKRNLAGVTLIATACLPLMWSLREVCFWIPCCPKHTFGMYSILKFLSNIQHIWYRFDEERHVFLGYILHFLLMWLVPVKPVATPHPCTLFPPSTRVHKMLPPLKLAHQ